jgi:hypothetical protein
MARQTSQFPQIVTGLLNTDEYEKFAHYCTTLKVSKSQVFRALVEAHVPDLRSQPADISQPAEPTVQPATA